MTALLHAHSGLRYLVLLAAVLSLGVLLYTLATGRPVRATRGLVAAFTGTLDLQILLGVALVAGGLWYGALVGHLTLTLLAAVVAHVASARARRTDDAARAVRLRLVAVVVPLALIVGGILAIGRRVIGAGAAPVG